MIEKLKGLIEKYYEQLGYLFFGGLATLLNIVLALVFRWMGMPTTWNTLLDNVICILFAYCTNRIWVFRSHSRGMDALREFARTMGESTHAGDSIKNFFENLGNKKKK